MLGLLLGRQWSLLNSFFQFLDQSRYRVLNKDQWCNVLEFSRAVDVDLKNYDVDGACELEFSDKLIYNIWTSFLVFLLFRACDARRICRMAQGEQGRIEHSIKYFLENFNALIVHILPILGRGFKACCLSSCQPRFITLQWVEHNHLPNIQ